MEIRSEKQRREQLREHELKATPIRTEILKIFQQDDRAVPQSEILQKLSHPDRVTVYRTLQSFMEKGLIHEALSDQHETYYALCSSCKPGIHRHHHAHFKCNDCGDVSCIEVESETRFDIPGFQVDKVNIEITGLCAKCS